MALNHTYTYGMVTAATRCFGAHKWFLAYLFSLKQTIFAIDMQCSHERYSAVERGKEIPSFYADLQSRNRQRARMRLYRFESMYEVAIGSESKGMKGIMFKQYHKFINCVKL